MGQFPGHVSGYPSTMTRCPAHWFQETWEWVTCFLSCRRWENHHITINITNHWPEFHIQCVCKLEADPFLMFLFFLAHILACYFVHVDLHGMEHRVQGLQFSAQSLDS